MAEAEGSEATMREMGPKLRDLHWKESTGLGRESRALPEEALSMLEAARDATGMP